MSTPIVLLSGASGDLGGRIAKALVERGANLRALMRINGFPYSLADADQNFVGGRNRGGRFPAFLSLDVQATIGVRVPFRSKTYRGRAEFKVFNITNHFNPRDVQNNIDSRSFGNFYNGVGRQFRLKFEFLKF